MGVLRRMGKDGDIPTKWELDDAGSIQVAQEKFNDALGRRMLAFKMDAGEGERFHPHQSQLAAPEESRMLDRLRVFWRGRGR